MSTSSARDVRTVPRRTLHFDRLGDALADLQRLAGGRLDATGNRSPEEIVTHLAVAIELNLDGIDPSIIPLPLRVVGRVAGGPIGRYLASHPMRPGVTTGPAATSVFWPAVDGDLPDTIDRYAAAIRRLHQADTLPKHPLFGTMSPEQAEQFHCRHAELHLSFLHPAGDAVA